MIGGRLEAKVAAQARIPDCSRFLSSEHLASNTSTVNRPYLQEPFSCTHTPRAPSSWFEVMCPQCDAMLSQLVSSQTFCAGAGPEATEAGPQCRRCGDRGRIVATLQLGLLIARHTRLCASIQCAPEYRHHASGRRSESFSAAPCPEDPAHACVRTCIRTSDNNGPARRQNPRKTLGDA